MCYLRILAVRRQPVRMLLPRLTGGRVMTRLVCAEYGSCSEPASRYYSFRSARTNDHIAIPVCTHHVPHASGILSPIDQLVLELRAKAVAEDALEDSSEVTS